MSNAPKGSKQKLNVFHLVYENEQWRVRREGKKIELYSHPKFSAALGEAKAFAKAEQPSSLRIHYKDGRFRDEMTYPRSADPKRSKG